MAKEQEKAVQLVGDELNHMRGLIRTAEDSLRQIARMTVSKVRQYEPPSPHQVKQTRFVFDNVRVVIEDSDGCGVYEDPPGICRPCRPGE